MATALSATSAGRLVNKETESSLVGSSLVEGIARSPAPLVWEVSLVKGPSAGVDDPEGVEL